MYVIFMQNIFNTFNIQLLWLEIHIPVPSCVFFHFQQYQLRNLLHASVCDYEILYTYA